MYVMERSDPHCSFSALENQFLPQSPACWWPGEGHWLSPVPSLHSAGCQLGEGLEEASSLGSWRGHVYQTLPEKLQLVGECASFGVLTVETTTVYKLIN